MPNSLSPLQEELANLKEKELVYKHSETPTGLVSIGDATRCLERLEVELTKKCLENGRN